jgi:hypothetical protein
MLARQSKDISKRIALASFQFKTVAEVKAVSRLAGLLEIAAK